MTHIFANACSRLKPLLCAVALTAFVTGCGDSGDSDVVVTETSASPGDFSTPSPGESVITAPKTPKSPAVPSPSPRAAAASAAPGDGTVMFVLSEPVISTGTTHFEPRIQVELSGGAGSSVRITDFTGAEPGGIDGKLKSLKPGHYMMRLFSTLIPDYPLVERAVDIHGEGSETVAFGAIVFQIPKIREFEVAKAFEITVTAEPSNRPVFKGLLSSIDAPGLVGDRHPYVMLLPFGQYTYQLVDKSKDESIGFVKVPKGTAPEMNNNRLEISLANPVALVSLTHIIRTAKL